MAWQLLLFFDVGGSQFYRDKIDKQTYAHTTAIAICVDKYIHMYAQIICVREASLRPSLT